MTMQLREYQQRTDNDQEKVCESTVGVNVDSSGILPACLSWVIFSLIHQQHSQY